MKLEILDGKDTKNLMNPGKSTAVSIDDPSLGGGLSYTITTERMTNQKGNDKESQKTGVLDYFRPIVRNEITEVDCIGPSFAGAINIVQNYAPPPEPTSTGISFPGVSG